MPSSCANSIDVSLRPLPCSTRITIRLLSIGSDCLGGGHRGGVGDRGRVSRRAMTSVAAS
jgi:hypothetical protein